LKKDEETMITSPREETGSVAPNHLESKRTTRMDSFADSASSMAKTVKTRDLNRVLKISFRRE